MSSPIHDQIVDFADSTPKIRNDVLLKKEHLPYEHRLCIAPTVLQFSGDVFMAVDRHCMVSGSTINADDHQVSSFEDENFVSRQLKELVREFMEELRPMEKYCIVLYKTTAPFEHNHVLPTLIATYQLVKSFEALFIDDQDLKTVLHVFLIKHQFWLVDTSFENHIFEAIFQGSFTHVHIHGWPEYENIEYFLNFSRTEMIIITVAGFEPSRLQKPNLPRLSFQTKRSIQDFVRRNSRPRTLHRMMKNVKKRRNITQMEMDLERAMENFCTEFNVRNVGFDVQKKGVLMVVPNGTFENIHFLNNILNSILRNSRESPRMVTFDLLTPAQGVNVFFEENFPDKTIRKQFAWNETFFPIDASH